ncbi:hypothetical protein [Neobacillus muris]|uniref:hypothetical protein n=1 Tax=Neobacillus muris TaxID=2941334 RepID=UPI00203D0BA2|nr:hypothetical protein [Neobacillus muris]
MNGRGVRANLEAGKAIFGDLFSFPIAGFKESINIEHKNSLAFGTSPFAKLFFFPHRI